MQNRKSAGMPVCGGSSVSQGSVCSVGDSAAFVTHARAWRNASTLSTAWGIRRSFYEMWKCISLLAGRNLDTVFTCLILISKDSAVYRFSHLSREKAHDIVGLHGIWFLQYSTINL